MPDVRADDPVRRLVNYLRRSTADLEETQAADFIMAGAALVAAETVHEIVAARRRWTALVARLEETA